MFPLTLGEALDLNDNGRLGWPDLLGWTVLTTLGAFGVAVLTLVSLMLLVGLARGAHSTMRGLAPAARRVAQRGKHVVEWRTGAGAGARRPDPRRRSGAGCTGRTNMNEQ